MSMKGETFESFLWSHLRNFHAGVCAEYQNALHRFPPADMDSCDAEVEPGVPETQPVHLNGTSGPSRHGIEHVGDRWPDDIIKDLNGIPIEDSPPINPSTLRQKLTLTYDGSEDEADEGDEGDEGDEAEEMAAGDLTKALVEMAQTRVQVKKSKSLQSPGIAKDVDWALPANNDEDSMGSPKPSLISFSPPASPGPSPKREKSWRTVDGSLGGAPAPTFALDKVWLDDLAAEAASSRVLQLQRTLSFGENRSQLSQTSFDGELPGSKFQRAESFIRRRMACLNNCIVNPSSKRRLAWDFLGMACIGYDMIMIPFQLFEPRVVWWMDAMAFLMTVFWTIDIPSSFFVGYHQGGVVVTAFLKSAKKYATSWFPIDLLLVVSDWVDVLTHDVEQQQAMDSMGLARLGKSLRLLRIVRMLRLLRLMKLPKYLLQVEEYIQSEYANIGFGIFKLILCILVLNHFIACLWYGIGTNFEPEDPDPMTWVAKNRLVGASLEYRYATSMHWSLTQFTPASMEVVATNARERGFTIVVLIFAMVTFSSFVSSITNAMTRLRNINSDYAKQIITFQRYIRFHKVSTSLYVRMRRHLEQQLLREGRTMQEKDVQLVSALSDPLRIELHLEVYAPQLDVHAFFRTFCRVNHAAMRKLCHTAISELSVSHGDTLFSAGEGCENMLFVKTGRINYLPAPCVGTQRSELALSEGQHPRSLVERVYAGEWLCEACLWVEWVHAGDAVAQARCTLLGVNKIQFHAMAKNSRGLPMRPSRYAQLFVEHLNDLSDFELTDLALPEFDIQHAIMAACVRPAQPVSGEY